MTITRSTKKKAVKPPRYGPGDFFYQFHYGWVAGAGLKPVDPTRWNHRDPKMAKTYRDAYGQGREARRKASDAAARKFGYQPLILRANDASKR